MAAPIAVPVNASPAKEHRPRGGSLPIGTQVDENYHITAFLGSGAGGEVYIAIDRLLERELAMKILPPSQAISLTHQTRPVVLEKIKSSVGLFGALEVRHVKGSQERITLLSRDRPRKHMLKRLN